MILCAGIGELYGNVTDGICTGVSYSLDNSTLDELLNVVHIASLNNMELYVGIFDIAPNAAYEWSRCAKQYAQVQAIAFGIFVSKITHLDRNNLQLNEIS